MMPGEDKAFTTCLGTIGMYSNRRTLMCECMKFSTFQNFNKRVVFSMNYLILFARLYFQLL